MALGAGTFDAFGGAAKDIFAGVAFGYQAEGKRLEAGNYDQAAAFSDQNAMFTRNSTKVKQYQADRALEKSVGGAEADIAGAGFTESGSALDILRESMSQGAMQRALLGQQGAIQEAGYLEQARSYRAMADSSRLAAEAADTAEIGSYITGSIKAVTGFATLGF